MSEDNIVTENNCAPFVCLSDIQYCLLNYPTVNSILNRIRNSKWAQEVVLMGDRFEKEVSRYNPLSSAISKEITGRCMFSAAHVITIATPALLILDKKFDILMEKQQRLRHERKEMLEIGLPMLKQVWADVVHELPAKILYPSASEVFRLRESELSEIFWRNNERLICSR